MQTAEQKKKTHKHKTLNNIYFILYYLWAQFVYVCAFFFVFFQFHTPVLGRVQMKKVNCFEIIWVWMAFVLFLGECALIALFKKKKVLFEECVFLFSNQWFSRFRFDRIRKVLDNCGWFFLLFYCSFKCGKFNSGNPNWFGFLSFQRELDVCFFLWVVWNLN